MNVANVDEGKGRFYVDATMSDGRKLPTVLVDTGSMISSINLVTAQEFGLSVTSCPGIDIEYGNGTIQHTDCLASLEFSTKDIMSTVAQVYVVADQNEKIILGMDWMEFEEIWLMTHLKKIFKVNSAHFNSSQDIAQIT